MRSALAVELHGLHGAPEQVLKGAAAVRRGEGGGEFGGIGVAFSTQLKGNL